MSGRRARQLGPFFHGGPMGLSPGDWILPPSQTGLAPHLEDFPDAPHRLDRVYVTTILRIALIYAERYGDAGAVYAVEPRGITGDPGHPLNRAVIEARRALVMRVARREAV